MAMVRGHRNPSEPTRTCVACRAKTAQSRLLRYGLRDGVVSPRVGNHGPRAGRSAYLCPARRCFEVAVKRRALARALAGPPRRAAATVRPAIAEVEVEPLWRATLDTLEREIHLLRRTAQPPQAPPRLTGLEELLFELSSHPAPSDRRASAGKGGSPTHG